MNAMSLKMRIKLLKLNNVLLVLYHPLFSGGGHILGFSYFPFGFEGRIWDLIVSVPDHCLPFYFPYSVTKQI